MIDLIEKKKYGFAHTKEEIDFLIHGLVREEIPDYQISAWLMAVYFCGMTDEEIFYLTDAMAHSGDMTDLTALGERTVDKHSTGGVGDKTTLIVAPIVAAVGGVVAKMSGRGLGFTGGTVDKLEAIPGFRTELSPSEFFRVAKENGLAVVGQSGNLAPADKKLYALRDVTATVNSIPLIASSIMSKKLAAGAKSIVLDVKVGSGAFMKDTDSARLLAEKMVAIGKAAGRNISAILTNMDIPLGCAVGNALEVKEAVSVLEGNGPRDLTEVSLALACEMLSLSLHITAEEAREKCLSAIRDGSAKRKLCDMVSAQGGDASFIQDTEKFSCATTVYAVCAPCEGYISHMDAEKIGLASSLLGAGREKKGDILDMTAGVILKLKTGDFVKMGDIIAELHTSTRDVKQAEAVFLSALSFSDVCPPKTELIYEIVR
jgi:pyrimidine-nucleoside phosphorylase